MTRTLVLSVILLAACSVLWAQASDTADWDKAASGKMAFDVASVKQDESGPPTPQNKNVSSFPLDSGDAYSPNGGYFSATNFQLVNYIAFAYKLDPRQTRTILSELPKWANEDRYDIEARASGDPSKDQMRLMMQSLLAERFKLAIHRETHEAPVFALVVLRPGKLGPQLFSRAQTQPCDSASPLRPPSRFQHRL